MKKICFILAALPAFVFANEPDQITYTCDNSSKMLVTYASNSEGRPLVTLAIAGNTLHLALIPSASGTHYRGDGANLYTRGNDAMFDDGSGQIRRCTQGDKPPAVAPQAAPTAVSSFVDISGSVTYRQRIALPPDAILTVRVLDTSRAGAKARTLAEQTLELGAQQVPIPFRLVVDRDLLGKKARITLAARIESRGKLLFINDTTYPVKIDAGKGHVEMQLRQVSISRRH